MRDGFGQADRALDTIGDHTAKHVLGVISGGAGNETNSVVLASRSRQIAPDGTPLLRLGSAVVGEHRVVVTTVRTAVLANAHLLVHYCPAIDDVIRLNQADCLTLKPTEEHLLLLLGVWRVAELHRSLGQVLKFGKHSVKIGWCDLVQTHAIEHHCQIGSERLEPDPSVGRLGREHHVL